MSRNTLAYDNIRRVWCRLCQWRAEYNLSLGSVVPDVCPACSGSPMKAYTKVDQVKER